MGKTEIGWTDFVWNPVTGCSKVSEGCKNCYAYSIHNMRHKAYAEGKKLPQQYAKPFEDIQLHNNRVDLPFHWKKPRKIFVNSMGDLFHANVPFEFIENVFATMEEVEHHTYIVLTKRPERMFEFMKWYSARRSYAGVSFEWQPAKNIWLGITAENQDTANERIPWLLQTPAAVRLISCEPMLEEINLTAIDLGDKMTRGYGPRRIIWDSLTGWEKQYNPGQHPQSMPEEFPRCMSNDIGGKIDWVICGGETGSEARPLHSDWVRSLRDQCTDANVSFFFKQWGEFAPCTHYPGIKMPGPVISLDGQSDGMMTRVGKKKAGRTLDGRTWNEFPEVQHG